MMQEKARVMFLYWGRRGVMSRFTLELGRAVRDHPSMQATISVSRQNERYEAFAELAPDLFTVDTFRASHGALLQAWRISDLRKSLVYRLRVEGIHTVIDLMPHVWSPFMVPAIRASGARYIPLVHDADVHPGDPTGWATAFACRGIRQADAVVTLSRAVTARLAAKRRVPESEIVTLFLPDLHYGPVVEREPPRPGSPLRLAFFGRIMPYKGLLLFVEAAERLRAAGIDVEVGVFGEGRLGACARRLVALGAEVINRWLEDDEIGHTLSRYHAVVLSHVEASQSGVAATALGMGLPVVATPVGGLGEQIADGGTGFLAMRADGSALADAAARLLEPDLYARICRTIIATKDRRSMRRFVDDCERHLLRRHGRDA